MYGLDLADEFSFFISVFIQSRYVFVFHKLVLIHDKFAFICDRSVLTNTRYVFTLVIFASYNLSFSFFKSTFTQAKSVAHAHDPFLFILFFVSLDLRLSRLDLQDMFTKSLIFVIIVSNQSAFVFERLITDNIIVACEIIHTMNTSMKGKVGYVALKLNMSKEYGRVEWHFVEGVLQKMDFERR